MPFQLQCSALQLIHFGLLLSVLNLGSCSYKTPETHVALEHMNVNYHVQYLHLSILLKVLAESEFFDVFLLVFGLVIVKFQ